MGAQLFVMANGQYVTRNVGAAVIECGEFNTVDEIVLGQGGDLSLLGARTLEGFNAVVDARTRELIVAGPMPAAEPRQVRAAPRDILLYHSFDDDQQVH